MKVRSNNKTTTTKTKTVIQVHQQQLKLKQLQDEQCQWHLRKLLLQNSVVGLNYKRRKLKTMLPTFNPNLDFPDTFSVSSRHSSFDRSASSSRRRSNSSCYYDYGLLHLLNRVHIQVQVYFNFLLSLILVKVSQLFQFQFQQRQQKVSLFFYPCSSSKFSCSNNSQRRISLSSTKLTQQSQSYSRRNLTWVKSSSESQCKKQTNNSSSCSVLMQLSSLKTIIMCILIALSTTAQSVYSYGMDNMSPRVVLTKHAQFQGFLGPKNVRHTTGGGSYHQLDPYNFRTYGHPVVEIFKGIPYASPPVDSLRYSSPVPFPFKSNEVYSANVTKPACPRFYNATLDKLSSLHEQDPLKAIRKLHQLEDCLYLDIYAPLNTYRTDFCFSAKKTSGPGLPVLVYANSQADDPNDPFDGSSIAAIGQIIVVSFRYRVGVIGFLQPSYIADDSRSNFGLWDQLAALQWIRENINAFGGDENNVSLMGNDLDATLVSVLALSPLSQAYGGLFHRLILLNGSPFSPISINHRPLETTVHLSRALQCSLQQRSTELLNCLRQKPITKLLGAAQTIGSQILSYHFAPSVDGTIIHSDLGTITTINSQFPNLLDTLRRYDIFCGLGEGHVLPNIGKSVEFWQNLNLERFVTAAIKLGLSMDFGTEPSYNLKQDVIRAVKNEYGDSPFMRELVSDFLIVNPMIQLLNKHSETGKNTFFFVSKNFDPLHKAKHSELAYVFSTDIYNWKYVNSDKSKDIQLYPFEALISLIANFVRSGDPNRPDVNDRLRDPEKSWPKYKRDQGRYMKFGISADIVSKYRQRQVEFWSHVFPALLKPYLNGQNDGENNDNSNWQFPTHFDQNPYLHPNNITHIFPTGPGSGGIDSASSIPTATLSALTENTVIVVGGLILLLNILCFMGVFYQRQRLRRVELELRRKYNLQGAADLKDHELDEINDESDNLKGKKRRNKNKNNRRRQEDVDCNHEGGVGGGGVDDRMLELESMVESEPYQITTNHPRGPPAHTTTTMQMHQMPSSSQQRLLQQQQQATPIDALSETETDNGFGPNFLGPNYDPRTKVTRWMTSNPNGTGNSLKDRSSPPVEMELRQPPPIHETHYPFHHHHHPYPHHPQPVHIHINTNGRQLPPVPLGPPPPVSASASGSLGRHQYLPSMGSGGSGFGYEPVQQQQQQQLQHIPSLHSFHPPGSDIPYADSRTTSPSISNYPAPNKLPSNDIGANNSLQRYNHEDMLNNYEPIPKRTSVVVPVPIRNSIIIRELDNNTDEVESSEPRVQIKSGYGTLKRSVGVGSGENGNGNPPIATGESSSISNGNGNNNNGNGSSASGSGGSVSIPPVAAPPSALKSGPTSTVVQKVTFADGL